MNDDPLDYSRAEIRTQSSLVGHYAMLMADFAEVRDDAGVAYAFRRGLAHMRMASAALELIIEKHNQGDGKEIRHRDGDNRRRA